MDAWHHRRWRGYVGAQGVLSGLIRSHQSSESGLSSGAARFSLPVEFLYFNLKFEVLLLTHSICIHRWNHGEYEYSRAGRAGLGPA